MILEWVHKIGGLRPWETMEAALAVGLLREHDRRTLVQDIHDDVVDRYHGPISELELIEDAGRIACDIASIFRGYPVKSFFTDIESDNILWLKVVDYLTGDGTK